MKRSTQSNCWRAAKYIYKYEGGLRGFYKGFIPSTIFMLAVFHENILTMINQRSPFDIRADVIQMKEKYGLD